MYILCEWQCLCLLFSTESGATASSGDLAKANRKIKDLEHRLADKESKVMEITTELMESVKKNRDVSVHDTGVTVYLTCQSLLCIRVPSY